MSDYARPGIRTGPLQLNTYAVCSVKAFLELHGDRRYGDDKAVLAGIASLNGMPLTVIALEKGRNVKERVARNFGSAHPEGYRKALRLMKQAEKFQRPVLCLIDTSGATAAWGPRSGDRARLIAENLMEMMTLRTPVLALLIGEEEAAALWRWLWPIRSG